MALIDPPLYMQTDAHPARSFRALITETWDEGVMDLTAFQVAQDSGGASFYVDVSAGRAVVQGDSAGLQGNYMVTNDALINDSVLVSSAPVSNSRYDLIVLEVLDSTEDGGGSDLARIRVIAGTPAASPTVPATPNTAIPLARIGPITPSTTTITTSIITDLRPLAGRRDSPGVMIDTAGPTIPTGWLACDGSAVSRTTYARLFAEIGTSYGIGNGTTTFNLPDFRGKVAVPQLSGTSYVDTIGETGGEYVHTMAPGELASHNHPGSTTDPASADIRETNAGGLVYSNWVAGGGTGGGTAPAINTVSIDLGHLYVDIPPTAVTVAAQGSGTPFNVMQPYQVVARKLIRT